MIVVGPTNVGTRKISDPLPRDPPVFKGPRVPRPRSTLGRRTPWRDTFRNSRPQPDFRVVHDHKYYYQLLKLLYTRLVTYLNDVIKYF